ncbi:family 16 glycoside hydrolase [Bifidobacterium eulemuris]|uniref:galactosylceramidase n=1 Tax=Bifidobacterium eulemuris TaxID=1765219 RepID=A0A261G513_9BIFI|nr:family 16 glycoside hydrolase [Bifidobacterium eulemuris]OZG66488.1 Glycosyl hydrolase family 59 [Bifidobacterium eulemuris]QOL32584.1 DUF1080 domain-containing protein [Bifidobacterium eulemuris]
MSCAGTTIILTAGDVAAAARNRNGLTYKGFGVLSGNATSSLLMDYKAEQPQAYWRLLETLFGGERPLMNTVKVEMGNDRNNSTGPNPCVMRDRSEYPAVGREPGFQLAADARRYQPGVRLSLLRWMAPTWVRSNDDVYRWYKNTILAVYREYGVMADSVNPDVNERTADLEWVAEFARRVRTDTEGFLGDGTDDPNAGFASDEERELFRRIKVITSDEEITGTFAGDVIAQPRYLNAMDVASYHYSVEDDPDGNFTRLAEEFDKEVWNSEAQAVFSNSADRPNNTNGDGVDDPRACTGLGGPGGSLEMANTLIKGFVESRRTHAIYQPAIGACYEHMEYAAKELVSARDPWSGWIYYDAGCAALGHFARFSKLGWESADPDEPADTHGIWRAIPQASGCAVGGNNPVNGARHGEPSYLTLAAPDGGDFSTVIVNDSGLTARYRLVVDAALAACGKPLTIWRTAAANPGERYDAGWLKPVAIVEPTRGEADITVEPWSMVTITTLDTVNRAQDGTLSAKPAFSPNLPVAAEHSRAVLDQDPEHGVLYADDFAYADAPTVETMKHGQLVREDYLASRGGDAGATPRYTTDSNGAFEIVPDETRGHALRQQIDWTHAGNAWIEGDPRTAIGDMRWANYRVSVDVRFEEYPGRAPYVLLGAREMGGDKFTTDICGYDFKLRADGVWLLRRYGDEKRRGHLEDLRKAAARAGASAFLPGAGGWFTLALEVAGPTITVRLNGAKVTEWTDDRPQSAGRVNLGTSFDHVRFSNLRVERLDGWSPYYTALIDDMHLVSWDDGVTSVLEYDGDWTHENGQGMFTYMRTISRTSSAGASLSHTFDGTGLDVFGPSDGGARIDVLVDGSLVAPQVRTMATSGALRTQLRVEGLERGRHTVTLRLANHALWQVDAIGVLL